MSRASNSIAIDRYAAWCEDRQQEKDMIKEKFETEKQKTEDSKTVEEFFADMEDEDAFHEWLQAEYDREADILEESLTRGRRYEDHQAIVEKLCVSRENFYERLKEEGLLEDMPKEEKIIPMKKSAWKKGSFRIGKIAGVAGVCILCVFSATMSSEANRNYFIDTIRYLSGNDTRVVVGNDEANEDVNTDEYEAIQDIEEKLGVEVPEFYYRPKGFRFEGYMLNDTADIAHIEYIYGEKVCSFCIDKQYKDTASDISSFSGKKTYDYIKVDGINIVIEKIDDQGDISPTYRARWNRNDVTYYLSGKIELEEIKKILEYMKF